MKNTRIQGVCKTFGVLFPSGLNVIVADDNMAIRQILGAIFEAEDCRAVLVENGRMVLEALEEGAYDLILMDLQMPIMDGIETTSSIRAAERETGRHIPILAMSGLPLDNGWALCADFGMDEYLEKPFALNDLYKAVVRLTELPVSQNWKMGL